VDVFQAATTLLNLQRQSRRGLGGRGGTEASPNTYTASQVTEGLCQLETELGGGLIDSPEIRDRLLGLLRSHEEGGESKRISDSQADAMDVVGSLVASIREDNLLTEGVKQWVKRLELTLHKLATQDPDFLKTQSGRPHAAMQVLNQLAKLGNAGDEGEGIDREVGREVDSVMERVIDEFDEEPTIFTEALDRLNPLVDRQTRTYHGNIQRTVRASEGQQRLARARRDVVSEVEQRLAGQDVPVLILDLLNPGWRNLLVHHHLRHGPDSESWNEDLGVLERLWGQLSGRIAPGSAEFVEPSELLSAVDAGLTSISFEPGRRTPLLRRLSQALRGEGEGETVRFEPNDSAKAVGLEDVVPETDPAPERADPASQREWRQWLVRARKLKVGDWLAVSDDSGGGRAILSLAWVGEAHASFVLVNRKGIKVRELNLRELVQCLTDGTVLVLDEFDLPLMERASHRMLQNMHNQLAYQASHDELTGLINRKEFENRLEKAIVTAHTEDQRHVVLYSDLDQFKIINNTAGHSAGDELLKILARKLRHELRGARGTLARLGGDEFGALLEQVTPEIGVEIAQRQLEAIRNYRFDWEDRHFSLSASVGVVNIDESVEDVNELMKNADAACYAAKDAGRNRIQIYEPHDSKLALRTGVMEWVAQIDRALDENRLLLNYQRIVPIAATNAPPQFEFLLTMLDDEGNKIAPADFIHAAETYNRMTAIDRWVIHNALEWLASRGNEVDALGHFSINLSGHSLNDEGFADYVLEELTRSPVPTSKICFEITETAAIANLDQAVEFMNRMKIIGCHFALDDFGTGLSSYSYLRNLPVDYLKIDGVFVKDLDRSPGDFAVVKSINEIGHVMGKLTIAEFVENDDILERLHEIGVDYGQGYGIERPRPLSEFKA
jgi:diguanylate cyclase (GGDEF)-like protein